MPAHSGRGPSVDIPVDVLAWWLAREKPAEEGVVYVSELPFCPLKRYYRRKLPPLPTVTGRIIHGVIVHAGLEVLLREVYGPRVKTERDTDLTREKTVHAGGRAYRVRGRIDAILDGTVGIEVKSALDPPASPPPWHLEQARIYNWLYELDHTVILYVTAHGLYQHHVHERYTTEDIARILEQEDAPRYPWECRVCPYRAVCKARLAASPG